MPIDSETLNKEARAFKAKPDLPNDDEVVILDLKEELAKARAEGRAKDAANIEELRSKRISKIQTPKDVRPSQFDQNTKPLPIDSKNDEINNPSEEDWVRSDIRPPTKSEIVIDKILRFLGIR